MPTCPDGHESASADFCDTCGMRIAGAPAAPAPSAPAAVSSAGPGSAAASSAGPGSACPQCGAHRSGQFCEACGFNFATGAPAAAAMTPPPVPDSAAQPSARVQPSPSPGQSGYPAPSPGPGWQAVVTADRQYFDSVIAAGGPDAASIEFPAYCPERRFALAGQEMRVGRRSTSRGLEPEIDLTGPPTDPGISHLHAVLIAQPDGSWSVLDPGSSNGTQVNGTDIMTGVPVPLHDSDRVCLGAWTVLTIQSP
ncbi:MAG TPA: FHA domain-containing protein [Streptosporangiaceae bacterium]|nr:FHA domain-containing protein [Streptosporangiaceae bacterium]